MTRPTVTGKVHLVEPTKTFGAKGFRKRTVVLEQPGKWTNYIPVEFIQDGCDMADGLNVGDEIEVTYKLTGRKWEKTPGDVRYFLSAEVESFQVISPIKHPAETTPFGEPVPPTPMPDVGEPTPQVNRGPAPHDEIPF